MALVDVLSGFRSRGPAFHAIVFVRQRNHARVLVDLLRKAGELEGWVRADWLVGHGGTEEEGRGLGMNMKQVRLFAVLWCPFPLVLMLFLANE